MSKPSWDIFISHAHEDKVDVAIPLAEALLRAGLRVWLDQHEILLGDSLTNKINEGLSNSKYGIVILSPAFLAKEWPKRELEALMAIELKHGKRILPILHNLQYESILREFPLIGGKLCVSTAAGIEAVVSEVCRATEFRGKDGGGTGSAAPIDPEVGTHIGSYIVEAKLGSGGSGVVYHVRNDRHAYGLALKLFYPLKPIYAHLSPLFVRGFRAMAAIQHPNVVGVHDHGVFDLGLAKRTYFTMDLIDGFPLDVWCGRAKAPKERFRIALPVFRQVAAALCAAHETSYLDEVGFEVRTVIHGDVKPSNIIVDTMGHARLIDFLQLDVQRLIDPRIMDLRDRTMGFGTPGFMAPEQERHGVATVATDIYGLGITFASAMAISTTSNPKFDLYRESSIPLTFRELVRGMVDQKPEKRPAGMREVLEILNAIEQ